MNDAAQVAEKLDVDATLQAVRERTGLFFPAGRLKAARCAVERWRAGCGASLEATPSTWSDEALDELLDCLAVPETYFLRERSQIQMLRTVVLPTVGRHRQPVRIWCAGCASGEEAYTLAILALDQGVRVEIVATDLRKTAIAQATAGRYAARSMRLLDAATVERYFVRVGGLHEVGPEARRVVSFARHNLLIDEPPATADGRREYDVVLCRNVLIYFDAPSVARVAATLTAALGAGGWLVTGPSDPPLQGIAPLDLERTPSGLVYRPATARSPSALPMATPPVVQERHPPSPPIGAPPDSASTGTALTAATFPTAARPTEPCDDAPRSLPEVERAIAADPLSPGLHELHGEFLLEAGHVAGAEAAFRRALFLDPTRPSVHFVLGEVLLRQGLASPAARAFRNAVAAAAMLGDADDLVTAATARLGDLCSERRAT